MCEWQCSQAVRNSAFVFATSSGSLLYWATLSSGCETVSVPMHNVSRTAAMDNYFDEDTELRSLYLQANLWAFLLGPAPFFVALLV